MRSTRPPQIQYGRSLPAAWPAWPPIENSRNQIARGLELTPMTLLRHAAFILLRRGREFHFVSSLRAAERLECRNNFAKTIASPSGANLDIRSSVQPAAVTTRYRSCQHTPG